MQNAVIGGFLILIIILILLLIIYWLIFGIGPSEQQYAQWLIKPGPCIRGQQAVQHVCTNPSLGCWTDQGVRSQNYVTIQACQPSPASARWQITNNPQQITYTCQNTGQSGPNMCTLAQTGQWSNSTSIELIPQPVGTQITVNSRPVGNQDEDLVVADNQIIWSKDCQVWPDYLGPRPLQEGTLNGGNLPNISYNSTRMGSYDLSDLQDQQVQLCRLVNNPQLYNHCWAMWLETPLWIVRKCNNIFEILTVKGWQKYHTTQNYDQDILLIFNIVKLEHQKKGDTSLNVLLLNLHQQIFFSDKYQTWKLNTSYPLKIKWQDSSDVITSKGHWLLSKKGQIRYRMLAGVDLLCSAYQSVHLNSQKVYLLKVQDVNFGLRISS